MVSSALQDIQSLLNISCPIKIVDIGANPIDGAPPYISLLAADSTQLVGFEPNQIALAKLNQLKGPTETYLPYAVGDGKSHTLYHCLAGGMTSLLEPNSKVLSLFYNFHELSRVVKEEEITTSRLDDIGETSLLDFLKIDIQGGELMVFEHATQRLKNCGVIHTEVEFLEMYIGQPLFSDIDQFLRKHGFMLHRFDAMRSRTFKPVDPYAGMNQLLWTDAIFIKDVTRLELLSTEQILKMAVILHECYGSYDVSLHLLSEYDRRLGCTHADTYRKAIESVHTALAFRQNARMIELTTT